MLLRGEQHVKVFVSCVAVLFSWTRANLEANQLTYCASGDTLFVSYSSLSASCEV
jgi:hypothetical protein